MAVKDSTADRISASERAFIRQWHHRPLLPIQTSPIFSWPLDPREILRWIEARWFTVAENSILVIVAFISWFWLRPSLEETKSFSFDWIAEIYALNFGLLLIVAGGLHLYFYTWRRQGQQMKYDARDLKTTSRAYTFNNQVYDNIFWSLGSGVIVWTAYEVLMFWAMANGYAPTLQWSDNPAWFVALFFLTPMWISLHFYCVHRWLHWPPLYRAVHALHHRNTNVGPWSGLSMHPVEHLIFFSSILIHWLLAAHPIHILFHMQHQALTAATSHTGFESLLVKKKNRLGLGTFHHQIHHRYFECNYGNLEVPCDKWSGSFHNGTVAAHDGMKKSIKQKRSKDG